MQLHFHESIGSKEAYVNQVVSREKINLGQLEGETTQCSGSAVSSRSLEFHLEYLIDYYLKEIRRVSYIMIAFGVIVGATLATLGALIL